MIKINKAILHVLDENTKMYFCSDDELEMNDFVDFYITTHLEKLLIRSDIRKGHFFGTNELSDSISPYRSEGFVEATKKIAAKWFDLYISSGIVENNNLLCIEYTQNDILYFAILEFKNKEAYIRNVGNSEDGLKNEIMIHHSVLPSVAQSPEQAFVMNTSTKKLLLKEKKQFIHANDSFIITEHLMHINTKLSLKESFNAVDKIVKEFTKQTDTNLIQNMMKTKHVIKDTSIRLGKFEPKEVIEEVFEDAHVLEDDIIDKIRDKKLSDVVEVEDISNPVVKKKHKIKTDMGIEITIPVDFVEAKDFLNIINNADGTISIELNHVGKIVK